MSNHSERARHQHQQAAVSRYKEWMQAQKKEDPEFYNNVQQGKPVPNSFKDYNPNQNISFQELSGLDNNFIFNDPEDE